MTPKTKVTSASSADKADEELRKHWTEKRRRMAKVKPMPVREASEDENHSAAACEETGDTEE